MSGVAPGNAIPTVAKGTGSTPYEGRALMHEHPDSQQRRHDASIGFSVFQNLPEEQGFGVRVTPGS
ncbi:hypothetical protein SAZ11_50025 [Streptomyces sp. FXJ1.4098]|nr:hypothetical protein [Streptomyces sp. FXJ1.4098]